MAASSPAAAAPSSLRASFSGPTSVAMTVRSFDQHVMDASAAREKRPTHRGFSLQSLDTSGYISGHDMPSFIRRAWAGHGDFEWQSENGSPTPSRITLDSEVVGAAVTDPAASQSSRRSS